MKVTFSWRPVKFLLTISAALALCAQILLGGYFFPSKEKTHFPKPSPLPPDQYRVIAPATYKYLLNQPAACRDRTPFLVFVVPVGPGDRASRNAIRTTWGAAGLVPGVDTLTVFYTGMPEEGGRGSASRHRELAEESRRHGDIIQMDFLDTYRNLTVKTVLMMNWLSTHCPDASYAMKVDADVFVNVYHLVKMLRGGGPGRRDFITGSVIADGRPRRDRSGKWYLSEAAYADDRFPPYVSGAGYVFSGDLAAKIASASRYVRPIPLEDVYVGLCLRVLGVRPASSRSFWSFRNLFEVRRLEYDRCTFAKRVIVNGFEPSQLQSIWGDFSRGHLSC